MKKLFTIVLQAALCLLATNLSAQNLDKETQAIPPGFGKEKTVLIALKSGNGQVDKALEKAFEKYYTGAYEIMDMEDMASMKKKADVHYYLFQTITDHVAGSFRGGERISPTDNFSYSVRDMKTFTEYKLSFFGGGYKKLMESYIQKLEEERKKNEGK